MANGKLWTEDDIALALDHDTYAAYTKAGGDRSESAWRSARYKQRVASAPEPPELPPAEDYDGDVAAYYEAVKQITAAKINLVDKPITLTWTAPDDNWTGIVFLGDMHIGGLVDYGQLESDLDTVQRTDGLYIIGMGDYGERFEHSGKIVHAMSGDTVPGSDDQELLVSHVLRRCEKWIAVLAGNHDDWGSADVVRRLARHLHSEYVSQAGCSLRVLAGTEQYLLYLKHQYTGASRISTSNESRRFWNEFGVPGEFGNADATVVAHLHQPDTHQVERKGNTVSHLRGGTYKTVDPWARKGGYCPTYGPSLILFNPTRHETIPFHGPLWRWGVVMLKALREGRIALEDVA